MGKSDIYIVTGGGGGMGVAFPRLFWEKEERYY